MKRIIYLLLLFPFISFGLSQITKSQEVITTVDCNQTGLVVNVGSYPNMVSLYHSGNYLSWPQSSNVIVWKITEVLPPQELFPDGMYTESWSFVHENVGVDQNSSVNACTLIPDPGECEAAIQMYYFNQETQQCLDFTWGGCGGVVPFESLAECEAAACSQSTNDCCINPDWINPMAFCPMIYDPVIGCDGVEYSNSCVAEAAGISSYTDQVGSETVLSWDCENQADSCIAYPIEGCLGVEIWDPVCGCDGVTYSNITIAACNSIYAFTEGECNSQVGICTSNSGVQIIEIGFWENPNDPCDIGECSSDGQFIEIVIDCEEEMGIPCNGEWVEVEGQCCSECVENVDLNEITNEEFRLIKMIDILGREKTEHEEGMILFYIYENGKVIKKIK